MRGLIWMMLAVGLWGGPALGQERRDESVAVLRIKAEAEAGGRSQGDRLREALVRRLRRMGETVKEVRLPRGCEEDPGCLRRELSGRVDLVLDGTLRSQGGARAYVVELRLFSVAEGRDRRRREVPCDECDEAALEDVMTALAGQMVEAEGEEATAPAAAAPAVRTSAPAAGAMGSQPAGVAGQGRGAAKPEAGVYWKPWRVAMVSVSSVLLVGGVAVVAGWGYDVQQKREALKSDVNSELGRMYSPDKMTPINWLNDIGTLQAGYQAAYALPAAAGVALVVTLLIPRSKGR